MKFIRESNKYCHRQMHKIERSINIGFVSHHKIEETRRKRRNHETESVRIGFNKIMLTHGSSIDVMLAKRANQPYMIFNFEIN